METMESHAFGQKCSLAYLVGQQLGLHIMQLSVMGFDFHKNLNLPKGSYPALPGVLLYIPSSVGINSSRDVI